MMHTSDHRRSVWYKKKTGFTASSDALYRSFTEEEEEEEEDDDENSKITYERFLE